jgi:hypothetical protein
MLDSVLAAILLTISFQFAQVYGCDTYGAAAYSKCPAHSHASDSLGTQQSPNPQVQASPTPSSRPPQSSTTVTTLPQTGNSFIDAVRQVGYGEVFAFSLITAIVIAVIIWYIKKHRRHDKPPITRL